MKLAKPGNRKIVLYPDPVLKRACAPAESFGSELVAFADEMLALMRDANGVGLAAPQVGVSIRLFVCNVTGEPGDDLICVNPRFAELSGADEKEEGCLSIPGVSVTIRRATRAVLVAFDVAGSEFTRTGEDLLARVWQHESDHLDGRLITDNMSPTDEIANRRAVRLLRADHGAVRRL